MMGRLKLLVFVTLTFAAAALAAPPDALKQGETGLAATVVDGDTLRLKDNAADIRLVGIQAPKLPLGRKGFQAWPLADEAKQALIDLVQNRALTLRLGTTAHDRNGRTLAHLVRDDGLWIQAEMLRQGWARVYTFPDNRRLAADMLALEAEARKTKRGIWAHPFYDVRKATDDLNGDIGTFQIVTGIVIDAAKIKERIYLNFGENYRIDFTVSVDKSNWRLFEKAGVDLPALKGRGVEVRGWITSSNGPMIEATHPEQIVFK